MAEGKVLCWKLDGCPHATPSPAIPIQAHLPLKFMTASLSPFQWHQNCCGSTQASAGVPCLATSCQTELLKRDLLMVQQPQLCWIHPGYPGYPGLGCVGLPPASQTLPGQTEMPGLPGGTEALNQGPRCSQNLEHRWEEAGHY